MQRRRRRQRSRVSPPETGGGGGEVGVRVPSTLPLAGIHVVMSNVSVVGIVRERRKAQICLRLVVIRGILSCASLPCVPPRSNYVF